MQSSFVLARHFDVSTRVIDVRLDQTGLRRFSEQDRHGKARKYRYYRIGTLLTTNCGEAA